MILASKIDLEDAPQVLQETVNELLEGEYKVDLLLVDRYVSTPYKDKSLVETTYKAYLEWGSLFFVYEVSRCPGASWDRPDKVRSTEMVAGDIYKFVMLSETLRGLTGLAVPSAETTN